MNNLISRCAGGIALALASVASPAAAETIPLTYSNSQIHVTVRLGGQPVVMLLDTGAPRINIPQAWATWLIANGHAVADVQLQSMFANGSRSVNDTILIDSVVVGRHVRYGVQAVVEPDGSPPLLGMAVLNAISGGHLQFDLANGQLAIPLE